MSFDYKFETGNDEVYMAYTVPYSYTQMMSHIKQLKDVAENSPQGKKIVNFSLLGKSIGGLDMPLIKITNRNSEGQIEISKPTVLIIGRQHSGETHSSFIIHGLINFLLSRDP